MLDVVFQPGGGFEAELARILIQRAVEPGGGHQGPVIKCIQRDERASFGEGAAFVQERAVTGPSGGKQHIARGRDIAEECQQAVEVGDHFFEHGLTAGVDPVIFQPEDPEQRGIGRIGINAGRDDFHDHAVFQLGIGEFPERAVGDLLSAEQEIERARVAVGFGQGLAAPAARIVDDIPVGALAERALCQLPDLIADLVGADEFAAAAELGGDRGEAQDRRDGAGGFPDGDHGITRAARDQPDPGIVAVAQDQRIGHASQRTDRADRIAGHPQTAGDVHYIALAPADIEDREPVTEFPEVVDGEFTLAQPRDPAGAADREITVAEIRRCVVDMVVQRKEPDRVPAVFHRERRGGKQQRRPQGAEQFPPGQRFHIRLAAEDQRVFLRAREQQHHAHRVFGGFLEAEKTVPALVQMDRHAHQHFVAGAGRMRLFEPVQTPGPVIGRHRVVVAEHRERIVGGNVHAHLGVDRGIGVGFRGIIAGRDLPEILVGVERQGGIAGIGSGAICRCWKNVLSVLT